MPNESPQLEYAPFLFSEQTIQALTEAERHGEYTLERLREVRPEAIKEVIRLRGNYMGQLRIGKILGLHHRTIAAIDLAYPEHIAIERQKRISKLNSTADKLVELVDDNPESVPPNVRCLAASQLYDKAAMLVGPPTLKVQVEGSISIFDQINALANDLHEKFKQAKAHVVEPKPDQDSIDIALVKNLPEIGVSEEKSLAIIDAEKP